MISTALADVHLSGTGAVYFLYALTIPAGLLAFVIMRTSPSRRSQQAVSRVEMQIGTWLWHKQRTRASTILGAAATLGAIGCVLSSVFPMATYTDFPMYPGDPFAGVQEIEGTARGLALALGLIVGLLSVRRAFGGEGITVPICLLLATLLGLFSALAIADFISNAATGPSKYMSAVVAGPGLFTLPAGAVVAWIACAADLAIGLRRAVRSTPREARPSPPRSAVPLKPADHNSAHLIAQSMITGVVLVVLVVFGWLSAPFLIVGLFMIVPNAVIQFYIGRRKRLPFRLDRSSIAVVAGSLAALAAALGWALVRPDPVFAVPSNAKHVSACGSSVTVPDVGNQVNRSIAGSTTVMTVGSKIYVEDSPVGSAALPALALDGPSVVCAAGGSGFGEVMIGTRPGAATLYVRTTGNVTYRIQIEVTSFE